MKFITVYKSYFGKKKSDMHKAKSVSVLATITLLNTVGLADMARSDGISKIVSDSVVMPNSITNGPESETLIAPPPVRMQRPNPLTTRFALNGFMLDAGTKPITSFGAKFGGNRNTTALIETVIPFGVERVSTIEGGVGVLRQSGWYAQAKVVERDRTVEWSRVSPVDVLGFDLSLTVTGSCMLPGVDIGPDDVCTFTPGILTGVDDTSSEVLIPNRFNFGSRFGEKIDPVTSDALRSPGFQSGTDEEPIGISLKIPNAGEVDDPLRMSLVDADRTEFGTNRAISSFSRVDQTVRSNDTGATIDRTIRGFVALEPEEWDSYTLVTQLSAFVLPSWRGTIGLGEGGQPRSDISNNLFFAANNQRIPDDSFTMFETGAGYVVHPKELVKSAGDTPEVFYNSVWLGVSPVRTVAETMTTRLIDIGEPTISDEFYREGGFGGSLDNIFGQIAVIDTVGQSIGLLDLQQINDLYLQAGLEVTQRDALRQLARQQRSTFSYVPHVSFSGNRTDGNSVFRYYTGALGPNDPNLYVGADVTYVGENGFRFSTGAIGYSNPSYDYHSMAEASLSQEFQYDDGSSVTIGVTGMSEFNRPSLIPTPSDISADSDQVEIFGKYQIEGASMTARARASGSRNGTLERSFTLGVSSAIYERSQFAFQITPYSASNASILAEVSFSTPLSNDKGAPILQGKFFHTKYDFEDDAFGRSQSVSENTFRVALEIEF